jgi:hypothetical protein
VLALHPCWRDVEPYGQRPIKRLCDIKPFFLFGGKKSLKTIFLEYAPPTQLGGW